jgi:acetyltransferase-like isoleucine patch superfamily enzyme
MHGEQDAMVGQNRSAMLASGNCAGSQRPRTALVFVANRITRLLPTSRCFGLKAFLYRSAGYQVSHSCRIISSAQIWGNCQVTIGDDTFIGHDVLITGGESRIEIGRFVDIGPRVCIVMGTHVIDMYGANSTILGGVRLGRKCVIGAGSVVTRDIPPFAIAVGVPCRVAKIWNIERNGWDPASLATAQNSCQTLFSGKTF